MHPDAGTVTICGLDMDKDEREIRSRIGFVSGGASYYQRKRLRELTDVTKRFYPGWDDGRYARLVRQFSLDESKRRMACWSRFYKQPPKRSGRSC